MSVSEPLARLAVRSVDDLVGLVPYLIGFHPEESLVAMVLENGRVVVTARVDLDVVADPDALGGLIGRVFGRFPGAEGWFLAYTDDDALAWEVLAGCVELVGLARLGRLLQVGTDRWRADCPDGPEGPIAETVSPAAAQAAVLGLPARGSRRDLVAGIAGPPERDLERLADAFTETLIEADRLGARGRRRMLRRLLGSLVPLGLVDCVRLAVLASRPEGQLLALEALHQDNADRHLQRWTEVVRRCPATFRAAPLGLLGMAAWQTGDGALQMVCLEELDRIDPHAPLGTLLDTLNLLVEPPEAWEAVRGSVLADLAAWVRAAVPPASRPRT